MFLELEKKEDDRPALVDSSGRSISYGGLKAFITKMFEILPERCLVFILCRNSVGAAAAYLAALNNRIVPLMLGDTIDRRLLQTLTERYQPSYVWQPCDMTGNGETAIFRAFGYDLIACRNDYTPMYEKLSLLLSTSGSTGSPKLVRHSYCNLEANARNIADLFELDAFERPMLDLPIQYTYGLSVLNSHIYSGATVLLSDFGIMQGEYWDFFKKHEATSITGVPYTYEMMKAFRIFRMKLPSLKLFSQGGGKLDEALQREYAQFARETGRRFIITYGQTEGTARMAYLPAGDALDKLGSIGKAIPGGKLYLVDEDGNRISEADKQGEMVYEGANVTLGYAVCKEDLLRGNERNGVLYTGDVAKQDQDGYFYIVGRKKRFLKLYGNRVSLDECEQMIRSAYHVECACTGIDNEMHIYVTGDCLEDIARFLSELMHINQNAFQMIRLERLPRNEAGKILYSELA